MLSTSLCSCLDHGDNDDVSLTMWTPSWGKNKNESGWWVSEFKEVKERVSGWDGCMTHCSLRRCQCPVSKSKKTTRLIRERRRRTIKRKKKKKNERLSVFRRWREQVNEWSDLIGGNTRHPALCPFVYVCMCVWVLERQKHNLMCLRCCKQTNRPSRLKKRKKKKMLSLLRQEREGERAQSVLWAIIFEKERGVAI